MFEGMTVAMVTPFRGGELDLEATARVVVPLKPRAAKQRSPSRRIASRRSPAVGRLARRTDDWGAA